MKVEFILNIVQLARARVYVANVEETLKEFPVPEPRFYAGNLVGWEYISQNKNKDQFLELTEENGQAVMRFTGQRNAMKWDGLLGKMVDILGNDWKEAKYSLYNTTDTRLKWWQTHRDWVIEEGGFEDILKIPDFSVNDLPSRFRPEYHCILEIWNGVPEYHIQAEFSAEALRNARAFCNRHRGQFTSTNSNNQ